MDPANPYEFRSREEVASEFYNSVTREEMEGILSREFGAVRNANLREVLDEISEDNDSRLDRFEVPLKTAVSTRNRTVRKINRHLIGAFLSPNMTLQIGRASYMLGSDENGVFYWASLVSGEKVYIAKRPQDIKAGLRELRGSYFGARTFREE